VVDVRKEPVDVTVTLGVSAANDISAVVTHGAVEDLRLAPGRSVVALVQSYFVTLAAQGEVTRIKGRNRLEGNVTQRIDGAANSEIQLDIGDGKILTAVVPKETADDLRIAPGDRLDAFFNATHVVLAAD
jgi:molybdate transport system regulatory protein